MHRLPSSRLPITSLYCPDGISCLIGLVCIFAVIDLWRQYSLHLEDYYFNAYSSGSQHSNENWKLSFRLENLWSHLLHTDQVVQNAKGHLSGSLLPIISRTLRHHEKANILLLRHSRIQLSHMNTHGLENLNFSLIQPGTFSSNTVLNTMSVYQLYCGNKEYHYFHIGRSSFETYPADQCRIFYSPASSYPQAGDYPHTLFQLIPLSNDGSLGLRSIINNYFLRAVPPPSDSGGAWKIVLGGPSAGAAERFRFTPEGELYSSLASGLVECNEDQVVSISPSTHYEKAHAIRLKPISSFELQDALALVNLSSQLRNLYSNYTSYHQGLDRSDSKEESNDAVKICIGVPLTSKGTDMDSVSSSPFWAIFFDSFMNSIDWKANTFIFRIYLGFDMGDPLYDTGDAWQDIRIEFKKRVTFRLQEQLLKEDEIERVLEHSLSLKMMHFKDLRGAPSQIVSQLMLQGFHDKFDYFYQVNDDTSIVTGGWPAVFINALKMNVLVANLGVTGPSDSNNERIFTHSFVHRTHIEVGN